MNELTYKKAWERLAFSIEGKPEDWNRERIKILMASCLEDVRQEEENGVEYISEDDIPF